ncbi:hypothetical protein ALC57_05598 [Trachymyrmex cornetzi]|uniref:Integrase zinc-binding domain-containing protein n=1 Tax=Trachymyrmex cornetzi TaxID=471704 RepID=A0A151JAV6_9HYME|nr:hypothetical protein ALC57_05598 [Trachymyrmex cornetzi]
MIPKSLQYQILKELHSGHFGVVKIEDLARSYETWNQVISRLEAVMNATVHSSTGFTPDWLHNEEIMELNIS